MRRLILLFSAVIGFTGSVDAQNYLTLTAETAGSTFMIKSGLPDEPNLAYSTNGEKWMALGMNTEIELQEVGDKAMIKGINQGLARGQEFNTNFVMTGKISASGSVMSLIDGDGLSLEIPTSHCFFGLFENCESLTQAPELGATKLKEYCYGNMFSGCKNLRTAPELPATEVVALCYDHMFTNCTSLKKAPKLPAKVVYMNSYSNMFKGCTALQEAPELPAETLGAKCYWDMFKNCKSLRKAPLLPARDLKPECYHEMFMGCDNLENKDYAASITKSVPDDSDDTDTYHTFEQPKEVSNEHPMASIIEAMLKSNNKLKTKGKTPDGYKYKVVIKKDKK